MNSDRDRAEKIARIAGPAMIAMCWLLIAYCALQVQP